MYYELAGSVNTETTMELVKRTVMSRDIHHIVVASNTGNTALLLHGADANIVCVSHVQGFIEPGINEMSDEMRQKLMDAGIRVLTTTHLLSGAERGIGSKFGGAYPVEIIAHTLRMLGQGTKVCVEISVMALDAGLIPFGKEIIAIAGTGRGADTAIILKPAHASRIFDTKILEYICKPMKF